VEVPATTPVLQSTKVLGRKDAAASRISQRSAPAVNTSKEVLQHPAAEGFAPASKQANI